MKGGLYWVDNEASGATIDTDSLTPQWIVACPYEAHYFYTPGSFVANAAGEIMECWDMNYCSEDPDTDVGKKGWGTTPFTTAGIDGYDASTCEREWIYVDQATTGMVANLPYKMGDLAYDSNQF